MKKNHLICSSIIFMSLMAFCSSTLPFYDLFKKDIKLVYLVVLTISVLINIGVLLSSIKFKSSTRYVKLLEKINFIKAVYLTVIVILGHAFIDYLIRI